MLESDLKIKKATLKDIINLQKLYRQVDLLHYQALPEIFNSAGKFERTSSWFETRFEDDTHCILVAEYKGEILGLVEIQIRQTNHPLLKLRTYGHIRDIIVDQAWRKQGIGKSLMQNAHKWAKQQGASSVEVIAFSFNVEALSFYRNLGYLDSDITLRNTFENSN
jgi:ribosomal protein S18 acetylase RimI-like enzyme